MYPIIAYYKIQNIEREIKNKKKLQPNQDKENTKTKTKTKICCRCGQPEIWCSCHLLCCS